MCSGAVLLCIEILETDGWVDKDSAKSEVVSMSEGASEFDDEAANFTMDGSALFRSCNDPFCDVLIRRSCRECSVS